MTDWLITNATLINEGSRREADVRLRDGRIERIDAGITATAGEQVFDARGRWLLSYGDEPGPNNMADGAVWRFDPAGDRWEDITPVRRAKTDAGFGWGAVAVQADNPDVIIASTFRRYQPHDDLYRSLDGGRTWTALFPRSRFDHSPAPWTADAKPHWMADIEIDPFDPDRMLFVTGYGV